MFFIVLLALTAIAIAGSAAFFSVYGLANTFSGVFWSVVVMGGALEAGKLVAASYLYRYWDVTNKLLTAYIMAGIIALMVLTSGGIFGYLSSGYQTDVLPLKELNAQVKILDEEKTRVLARKRQIDDQIAKLPTPEVGKIDFGDPRASDAATRALAQTQRLRDAAIRSFQAEQQQVTKRANELEKEILALRQKQIKTEAHVGPIIYIANAFDVETDQATKWLVLLIIFAFDPMAVALTLAVNIAWKRREEETAAPPRQTVAAAPRVVEKIVEKPVEVIKEVPVEKIVYVDRPVEPQAAVPTPSLDDLEQQLKRQIRAYPEIWKSYVEGTSAEDKIEQLMNHYRNLESKQKAGATLTKEEAWEMNTIKEILARKGLDVYFR